MGRQTYNMNEAREGFKIPRSTWARYRKIAGIPQYALECDLEGMTRLTALVHWKEMVEDINAASGPLEQFTKHLPHSTQDLELAMDLWQDITKGQKTLGAKTPTIPYEALGVDLPEIISACVGRNISEATIRRRLNKSGVPFSRRKSYPVSVIAAAF